MPQVDRQELIPLPAGLLCNAPQRLYAELYRRGAAGERAWTRVSVAELAEALGYGAPAVEAAIVHLAHAGYLLCVRRGKGRWAHRPVPLFHLSAVSPSPGEEASA